MIIKEICDYLYNDFPDRRFEGEFTVANGALNFADIPIIAGQYFKIEGSVLNDGIYKHPSENLKDETFRGAIILLKIPSDVIETAAEIEAWQQANAQALQSPYLSESFGGYSYSKATSQSSTGGQISWRDVFGPKLRRYRKMP